ncbi:MAG: OmpA family protein [Muribaculaceae bacterium]|jgi:outer membrane protein OmpA-like peptidoglycan-associated protein|nr:OmpA family protein [Muribaculaceae bacterium]MBR0492271.1 OmpA family protein [Muribaculaceae bacterium]
MRRVSHILMAALLMMTTAGILPLSAKVHVDDIYEMSLDENLMTPEIKNDKQADRIQEFQYNMAVAFKQTNYDVEIMRDDEVIVITIPASQLFDPNDTVLNKLGEEQLKPFLRMLNNPGFYKLLLVMHSDNTGSSEYTLNLTRQRVNAIFDWFEENGSVDYVVPYALGETDPIVDNNSVESRKTNRRLEIFLIPEQTMLQQAKKGRINMSQMGKK